MNKYLFLALKLGWTLILATVFLISMTSLPVLFFVGMAQKNPFWACWFVVAGCVAYITQAKIGQLWPPNIPK